MSEDFGIGELVWTKSRNSNAILAKVIDQNEVELTVSLKRSKRANTILLDFLHEEDGLHHISLNNVWKFNEKFEEFAEYYFKKYDKGGVRLYKELRKLKWYEEIKKLEVKLSNLEKTTKTTDSSRCVECNRAIGNKIPCKECGNCYVHKKCGKVKGKDWTCANCSLKKPKLEKSLSVQKVSEEPRFSRKTKSDSSGYFVIPQLDPESTFQNILKECLSDATLNQLIKARQNEFSDVINSEQQETLGIKNIPEPEYGLRLFQLREKFKREKSRIVQDLIDQLHCAHLPGFETVRKLQSLYGAKSLDPEPESYENYRKSQTEVSQRLLATEIPKTEPSPGSCDLVNGFFDPENENSGAARKQRILKQLEEMDPPKPKLSPTHISGIARVIIDGTLANCEYTPGNKICHVGGGTNPLLLKVLLTRLKEKFITN